MEYFSIGVMVSLRSACVGQWLRVDEYRRKHLSRDGMMGHVPSIGLGMFDPGTSPRMQRPSSNISNGPHSDQRH